MSRLFDDFERTDESPATETESSFEFLNRVHTPFWAEVRRTLEIWFGRYPDEGSKDLREKFRSPLPGQHTGAWWELYLHELVTRLGYEITLHPVLPDSRKTPDFELSRKDSRLLLEATVVFSGIVSDGQNDAPGWLLDAVNTVDNGDFFVRLVEVVAAGSERLKVREVAQPLQNWLDALDPDSVQRDEQAGLGFPQLAVECRGWEVAFEAWPVSPGSRGRADHRVLGVGPMQVGYVNDIEQLQSKLKSKAGRYGRPTIPLLTAVLCTSSFMKRLDIEQALFGREAVLVPPNAGDPAPLIRQRNGFWARRDGPQNRRVSAVLVATGLHPANAPNVTPELWTNPWADHPLDESWPFPQATATERGEIIYKKAEVDMNSLLGLPSGWPGAEPFPRNHA